jgi:hypothetical protein
MKITKGRARRFWVSAFFSILAFSFLTTNALAQTMQTRINSATQYASNIFDAEVQLRGWENAADQQDRTDLEFLYSHALGMIGGVAKAHPEWLLEIEPMIENITHPIIRRAMILGVSVSQTEQSRELLKRWGSGEHNALVNELSSNGLAKIFMARPAQSPPMAVIYTAAFGATGDLMYVKNIVDGYADALPDGETPNPLLAEILGNYSALLATDDAGISELRRMADTDYRGIGEQLRKAIQQGTPQ